MVVDHVVKGMFAVTFEIGVKLGVVSVRGRMAADPKHTRHFEVAEAHGKEKIYFKMYSRHFPYYEWTQIFSPGRSRLDISVST